jgi:hypothetical protein
MARRTSSTPRPRSTAPRWSYVGSSNLTGAGLFRNLELNIDVQDRTPTPSSRLVRGTLGRPVLPDITAEIIDLIESPGPTRTQPTPFEVYLKVCHSLSQDARDGMGYVLPKSMSDLLLDYQESAVRTLSRRIVRRGGTMLGDVVGLGKTLTAVATALMLQAAEDYSTLVLCPKNLQPMWQEHLESTTSTAASSPTRWLTRSCPSSKRFNLVICDESHNLRNNATIAYDAIHQYIRANSSKVLLLTATPYNLAFTDVANQIGLYIDEDDDLGIVPSEALRKDPRPWPPRSTARSTPSPRSASEEPEDWKRLMSDHLVRRTRSFIKRTAKKEPSPSGRHVRGAGVPPVRQRHRVPLPHPRRHPTQHTVRPDDPAALMEDDTTLDAIRDLILPAYRLADYDNPKPPHRRRHQEPRRHPLRPRQRQRLRADRPVQTPLLLRALLHPVPAAAASPQRAVHPRHRPQAADPARRFTDRQIAVSDEDIEGDGDLHGSVATRYESLATGPCPPRPSGSTRPSSRPPAQGPRQGQR